jgi:hypothetical protein
LNTTFGDFRFTSTTTTQHQLHHHSYVPLRHSILLCLRLRMTTPFRIWWQRGRKIWRSDVIFRGSSLLCMHLEHWTLALLLHV